MPLLVHFHSSLSCSMLKSILGLCIWLRLLLLHISIEYFRAFAFCIVLLLSEFWLTTLWDMGASLCKWVFLMKPCFYHHPGNSNKLSGRESGRSSTPRGPRPTNARTHSNSLSQKRSVSVFAKHIRLVISDDSRIFFLCHQSSAADNDFLFALPHTIHNA